MVFNKNDLRSLRALSAVFFLWSICGCSSLSDRIASFDSYQDFWLARSGDVSIEQAFFSEGKLFFQFQSFYPETNVSYPFFSKAQWNPADVKGVYSGAAVTLRFYKQKEWERILPKDKEAVARMSAREWKHVRSLFAQQMVDEAGGPVRVQGPTGDQVFYRDETGAIHVVPFEENKGSLSIQKELSDEMLEKRIAEFLKEQFAQKGHSVKRILVDVAELNAQTDGPAFIFMDIENEYGLGLFVPPIEKSHVRNRLEESVKTTDYAIFNSYILGLASRPFSYAFRAVKWSQDMVYDTVTFPSGLFKQENTIVPPLSDFSEMDMTAFQKFLDKDTKRKAQEGKMAFLIDGQQFFSRLLEAIKTAKSSIDIRVFIFDNDDYAVQVADLLKKKSNEGVKVRVLLDSIGQIMGEGDVSDNLPEGFIPPYSMVSYLRKDSKIQVRVRPNMLFKADHTKTMTIDQRVCFLGGMNIGREYRYVWHDMMMEVSGPVLEEVIKEYDLAWAHAGAWGDLGYFFKKMFYKSQSTERKEDDYPVRLLYTRIDDTEIFRAQLEAIRKAKCYIWISNAYFSENAFLYELINARRRGVDVRVILPAKGNHGIMNKSNAVTANILFRNGIDVYFYPGMSHIKAAVYDGWLCTGSANFDKLSLRDNLEMNIATAHRQTVENIKKDLFEKDFRSSQKMTELLKTGLGDAVAEIVADRL